MSKQIKTSWETSSKWYDERVGEKGHYYHENVILPKLLSLMDLDKNSKLLDLGCGQGVLERTIPNETSYVGIDISKSFIKSAKERSKNKKHEFLVQDITKNFSLPSKDFTHAAIILALQNVADPLVVFKNVSAHLSPNGSLFIVLNHPCFRIPRHCEWGIDEKRKLQYRKIDSYLSPLQIPIQTHPGKQEKSETTWSFHFPISTYTKFLKDAGFCITLIEEWISDKTSTGSRAKMENRARNEFPLFLTFICKKLF